MNHRWEVNCADKFVGTFATKKEALQAAKSHNENCALYVQSSALWGARVTKWVIEREYKV